MLQNSLLLSRRLGLLRQISFQTMEQMGGRSWLPSWTPAATVHRLQYVRTKKDEANLSALFKPVPVKASPGDGSQVGAELCGHLDKGELLKLLNRFTQKRETKLLCQENGLDSK